MIRITVVVALLGLGTLAGCAAANFEKTAEATYPPKGQPCKFEVFTTKPSKSFEELGVLTFQDFGPTDCFNTIARIKEGAAVHVCKHGGDAVLVWDEVNPNGCYIKGTVIRYAPKP